MKYVAAVFIAALVAGVAVSLPYPFAKDVSPTSIGNTKQPRHIAVRGPVGPTFPLPRPRPIIEIK